MRTINNIFYKIIKKYKDISVVAKAGLWFVACTMIQKSIAFITVPIFTRLMPTQEYGLYSTYLSWYSLLTVFCTLNMHSVIYVNNYTKADSQREKDKAAIPLLTLSTVLTLSIFFVYVAFHGFLDKYIGLPFALVCLLFAQILFEPPVNLWNMKQRFEYKYVLLVIRTLAMVLLNAFLGIVFVWLADANEAIYRAFSIVLVQVIFGATFYIYFWKRGKSMFSTKGWKHILKVQFPLLPHSLSLTILSSSDRIMISNLVGDVQTGIYSVAYSAGYVVNVFKNSIVDALKPWLYQKIKVAEYETIRKTVNTVMALVLMISVVFTAFAPEVIYFMAPAQYHEAIYVIPPVVASSFFTFLYNIFSIVGLYYEKSNKIMVASVSGAVLNLILNLVCIPMFGYIAAAYTTLFCYVYFSFAHYTIMKSICKENGIHEHIYDVKFILLLSAIMLFFAVVFTLTYKNIYIRYGIILGLVAIIFFKRKIFVSALKSIKKKRNNSF